MHIKMTLLYILLFLYQCLAAADYKRMIILIDEDIEEVPSDKSALTINFAMNIQQAAAPMLAPRVVVEGFLQRKMGMHTDVSTTTKQFFDLVDFDTDKWLIYRCKKSPYFLFVPQEMNWMLQPEEVTILDEQGVGHILQVPIVQIDNLEQFVWQPTSVMNDLLVWVQQSTIVPVDVSYVKKVLFNKQNMKTRLASDPKFQNAVALISDDEEKISTLTSSTKPWNFFIDGHGSYADNINQTASIVGLHTEKFEELLLFFNHLNTHLVAFSSCYAGGKNLDYIQFTRGLDKKKITKELTYIAAVISSGDSPSTTAILVNTIISGGVMTPQSINFSGINILKFFESLELKNGQNWLTDALKNIAQSSGQISSENAPQVLIPYGGWFQAFIPKSEAGVLMLGNVLIKKYEIEKKNLPVKQRHIVMVYPSVIPISLKTYTSNGNFPLVLSMKRGDATHIFRLVEAVGGIEKFIKDSFFNLKGRKAKKTFLIKKLRGSNDTGWLLGSGPMTFEDVVIESWVDSDSNPHYVYWFKHKKQYWKRYNQGPLWEMVFATEQKSELPAHYQALFKKLDDYEKVEWKRDIPVLSKMKKGDVHHGLLRLGTKLELLRLSFQALKDSLQNLKKTFGGTQVAPIPIPAISKAVEQCYNIIEKWRKGDLKNFNKEFLELIRLFSVSVVHQSTGISGVIIHTDTKCDIANVLVKIINKETQQKILNKVIDLMVHKNNVFKSDQQRFDAAGLAIHILVNLNESAKNEWYGVIIGYYNKLKQQPVSKVTQNKQQHFFMAELCTLFSYVTISNMYGELYEWIKKISPALEMNDFHRLLYFFNIAKRESTSNVLPEFKTLVNFLQNNQNIKDSAERVDSDEFMNEEKAYFKKYFGDKD